MGNIDQRLAALGAVIPEILIPKSDIDLSRWAVIACDQFTQDHSYWNKAESTAGEAPSTLRLIFPEIFLEAKGRAERIRSIHQTMNSYLREGIFAPPLRGLMYIERATPLHPCRKGLVLAVDLERYEWQAGSASLIRATEGTVASRLPPRMEIRRGAALESPHILLLIDDEKDRLLGGLADRAKKKAPCYSSGLMSGSGSVEGWFLGAENDWSFLADCLEDLFRRSETRYGSQDAADPHNAEPFLYAVGDGNHSLATAKAVWEEYKKAHAAESGLMNHPARFALVELENLYDPGIDFEPIHRVIFGLDRNKLLNALSGLPGFESKPVSCSAELIRLAGEKGAAKNRYGLMDARNFTLIESGAPGIATKALEPILDRLVQSEKSASVDYIHGEEECLRITEENADALALLLPPIKKEDLFMTVAQNGPLPRKSFSMGEAGEKRFYLECRKLFG